MSVLKTFVRGLRLLPHAGRWGAGVLSLAIASSLFSLLPAAVFGALINATTKLAQENQSPSFVEVLTGRVGVLVGFLALSLVFTDVVRVGFGFLCESLTNHIQQMARERQTHASLGSTSKLDRRDVSFRLNGDIAQIPNLYSGPLTTVVSDVLDTVFITIAIATQCAWLAPIVMIPLAPIYLIARSVAKRGHNLAQDTRSAEGKFAALIDRIVANRVVVAVFGGRRLELARALKLVTHLARIARQSNSNLARLMLSVSLLKVVATAGALLIAVFLAGRVELAIGSVATLMLYLTRYYAPAVNLAKSYQRVQRASVSVANLVENLSSTQIEFEDDETISRPPSANESQSLTFEDASVVLPNSEVVPIPNFALVGCGLVLLEGPSGVGKTTLLEGLTGVRSDCLRGTICVNGLNLTNLPLTERLRLFSYAGQDNLLFPGPLIDSVTYPHFDEKTKELGDTLMKNLKLAHLKDSVIDGDGGGVSGGEARRAVLARALGRFAPVLLLDEVTSSLDLKSRDIVEKEMVAASRTRIVIASVHRPSSTLVEQAAFRLVLSRRSSQDRAALRHWVVASKF